MGGAAAPHSAADLGVSLSGTARGGGDCALAKEQLVLSSCWQNVAQCWQI